MEMESLFQYRSNTDISFIKPKQEVEGQERLDGYVAVPPHEWTADAVQEV